MFQTWVYAGIQCAIAASLYFCGHETPKVYFLLSFYHRCPWIFFQGGGQKDPLEFRKISSGGGPGGPGGQQGVNRNLGEGGSSRGSF